MTKVRLSEDERKRRHAAAVKRWAANNPEKRKAIRIKYRATHLELERQRRRDCWANMTKEQRAASNATLKRNRQRPQVRLAHSLRERVRSVIKGKKSAPTFTLIGCDVQFLLGYIEARFKPGMSWKNYGEVWEIDHRIPCASYDLTDPSHQRSCFHYTNLQPMLCPENRGKKDKMPPTHQAELL